MTWDDVIQRVSAFRARVYEKKRAEPFYRGHADHRWRLQPALFRCSWNPTKPRQLIVDEQRIYWRTVRLGSHLLPATPTPWQTLFMMQHHGIPTRLLDWTESFATALWFALNETVDGADPCVWMLDPYRLNFLATRNNALLLPDYDFTPESNKRYCRGYEPYVVNISKKTFRKFPHRIAAVAGVSFIPRLHSQRGVFTLHRDPQLCAESHKKLGECFERIVIPKHLIAHAREYLAVSNVNSFTVFPDLEGLATYIRRSVLAKDGGGLL